VPKKALGGNQNLEDNQDSQPTHEDEENTEIYKMYEEMLQLVKDSLDTPLKDEIER
jgi:hypothetical protein